jgi:hypothetical protein
MRRTGRSSRGTSGVLVLARRLGSREARRLFVRFCHEVARFSDGFQMEAAPFDLSLRDSFSGFSLTVSPLRELFLVSIGEGRSFDVRVSSAETYVSALDLALAAYLAAAAKAAPAA